MADINPQEQYDDFFMRFALIVKVLPKHGKRPHRHLDANKITGTGEIRLLSDVS
jgi:hypothetical protein